MAVTRPRSGNSSAPRAAALPRLATAWAPRMDLPLRYMIAAITAFMIVSGWAVWYTGDFTGFYYHPSLLAFTHMMTLGWITMTIMGALYQLVPVALEVPLYSERLGRVQFWLMLIGVIGMVGHFWIWQLTGMAFSAGMVLLAVCLFVYNMGRTLLRLARWDIVAKHMAAALFYLLATAALGTLLALDRVYNLLDRNPLANLHSHAHLAALGWVTMTIFGVAYKLVPMFTVSHIQSQRLAEANFWILNAGVVGLFVALWTQNRWLPVPAAAIVLAIYLFVYQIYRVLKVRKKARLDWAIRHALTALLYLLITATTGFLLGAGLLPRSELTVVRLVFAYGFLALVGWVSLTIIGMMYKIFPFLIWYHRYSDRVGFEPVPILQQLYNERLQAAEYWAINLGIVVMVVGLLAADPTVVRTAALLIALAAALFGSNMILILSHLWRRSTKASTAKGDTRSGDYAIQHPD